jgi:thymidylate synthase (FAD)
MNIVKPYAKIISVDGLVPYNEQGVRMVGEATLKKIEWCGRISHRTEEAQAEGSWRRFIQAVVLDHGDWSIVEHASATVDFLVDRGITHELVRHRLFAFTQESTRFVNYEKKMSPSFILPPLPDPPADPKHVIQINQIQDAWECAINQAEDSYRCMIKNGVPPQIARSVFPNALASRIVITGNLRNWRHFLLMRTTKESHPQMREVTIPLLQEFKAAIPLLYDDIDPNARQIDNMRKPR